LKLLCSPTPPPAAPPAPRQQPLPSPGSCGRRAPRAHSRAGSALFAPITARVRPASRTLAPWLLLPRSRNPPRCRCDLIADGPAPARARPPAFGRGRPCRPRPAAIPASRGRARSGRAWPRPVGLAPRTPAPTPATPVPAKGPYGPQTCGASSPRTKKKEELKKNKRKKNKSIINNKNN